MASLLHNSVITYMPSAWQITFPQGHQMTLYVSFNRYSGNYSIVAIAVIDHWQLDVQTFSIATCQRRILMLVAQLCILTCIMFSSTIDYRWHVQRFPQDLKRFSAFKLLYCFTIHFETILIWFLCILGFQSISGFLFITHC